jgi:GT2 family glycosyltransferase
MMQARVFAVVVTYNRCALLARCLAALAAQDLTPTSTIVVDNASTDGTEALLRQSGANMPQRLIYERLAQNLGGAGGFARGVTLALAQGADWVWLMDDDAIPHSSSLATLLAQAQDPRNVYASAAQLNGMLAWPVTWRDETTHRWQIARSLDALPQRCEVESHPFLGFMIHRELIQRIGVPDAKFFISADDIEYSLRARKSGARIILARASLIAHPIAKIREYRLAGFRVAFLPLPPWRRYYDTRNRLLVARRHHGIRLWTRAVPGTLVRMVLIILLESNKIPQLRAAAAGLWDGLRGISGRRHVDWRLEA